MKKHLLGKTREKNTCRSLTVSLGESTPCSGPQSLLEKERGKLGLFKHLLMFPVSMILLSGWRFLLNGEALIILGSQVDNCPVTT